MIGKGTWIDKLAHDLLEREAGLGRKVDLIRVESGLGASGIPHIGSLGDAVRAFGVKLALENLGYRSELIAYSDDLDGLRKIPAGMPDSLEEHMAKPVSMIPDPSGCHDSYGMHMGSLLLEGLDSLGIKYTFRRAKDTYLLGLMKDQIHTILSNADRIGGRIAEMTGQEKFESSLPYFPVCAECGRLYTAEAREYLAGERRVAYLCRDAQVGDKRVRGCGYRGEAEISRDLGKLAWKVEFAARWHAFDVRFEAYGKDIMDSVRVNDWVSDEVLGYPHPHHIRYEMFLDKGGKKISKSSGNVVTSQRWLRYGTPQSILLLLYKRIAGARELGFEDIPALMDEYDHIQKVFFGITNLENKAKAERLRGLFEYVHLLNPPAAPRPYVSYRLLLELAGIFREDRTRHVMQKLAEYKMVRGSGEGIKDLIDLAGNYADDFGDGDGRSDINLDDSIRSALLDLSVILEGGAQGMDLQNTIYGIAKSNDVPPREFFETLYRIILNTTRGPRIGPFILDIGTERVSAMIRRHVE